MIKDHLTWGLSMGAPNLESSQFAARKPMKPNGRSLRTVCLFEPKLYAVLVKQLKEIRIEMRAKGPQARSFLRARPIPDRLALVTRLYLSDNSPQTLRALSNPLEAQAKHLERSLSFFLRDSSAALRVLASERLAMERITLNARDALYVQEAVTETHLYLTTRPLSVAVFESTCASSAFRVHMQSNPVLLASSIPWHDASQARPRSLGG